MTHGVFLGKTRNIQTIQYLTNFLNRRVLALYSIISGVQNLE